MSAEEEATINNDGSASFSGGEDETTTTSPPSTADDTNEEFVNNNIPTEEDEPPTFDDEDEFQPPPGPEDGADGMKDGIDPVVFVVLTTILLVGLWYFFVHRKKDPNDGDDFFSKLDGEKFNLKLPTEVDEYYQIKAKCEAAGWQPGKGSPGGGGPGGAGAPGQNSQASGPHRVLAQALMKRAIADIPIVTHIQKESPGMNKLYSQSMCSVNQWRAYQNAEALVSAEVDEVRAEAEEIEPGWSGVIWRQAMQYHNMLKQKHEMEAKAAEEQAKKRREVEQKVMAAKQQVDDAKARELAAEKAAEELIKQEEREKQSKKAFSGGGLKKGFLDGGGGGKGKRK